ncbi:hypothetical protein A1O7_03390 [Cladophialophora yegresii CBS 114405]|uniref:tRNA(Phe) 7-[(3-amino-3-carboxypropyl)-4-demethylwyosine(37)-N(4)]-methyltransferase n=1 Tax=Cladophialophora yegresii CBS 114405 TaxID=1182544 RepID=W9WEF0_9EURO|nr:uncharacterized protein A1O7_03390 [Cladophialophora yegresii CBS 114405]EXJ62946.1 hypothetical protein A1O7_03390 [Cladophialophora yegresii CBS 114405]
MTRPPAIPTVSVSIPPSFHAKKSQILRSLNQPTDSYTDNSPKGTVDAQIRDLIDEINAYEGFVTTSSCAGRVAVFVEGPRTTPGKGEGKAKGTRTSTTTGGDDSVVGGDDEAQVWHSQDDGRGGDPDLGSHDDDDGRNVPVPIVVAGGDGGSGVGVASATTKAPAATAAPTTTATTSPGGKGGGRWLFVSHDRIAMPRSGRGSSTTTTTPGTQGDKDHDTIHGDGDYFSRLFNLGGASPGTTSSLSAPPRLVHLTFSPLILHIHCASLFHARPLLSAAINAGFRESGVQSLRVLDPAEADKGVMVAVRTAGLGFDTVVGRVEGRELEGDDGDGDTATPSQQHDETYDADGDTVPQPQHSETYRRMVGEEYLRMCVEVVNERFGWNEERRERFRAELKRAMEREGEGLVDTGWEDKEARRRRKREEGLARQMRTKEGEKKNGTEDDAPTWRQRG